MMARSLLLFTALVLAAGAWVVPEAQAQSRRTSPTSKAAPKLYRWVDADGKVHYSDTVPAEALSQGRTEYSQGRVVNQVERAMTAQELAAKAAAEAATAAATQETTAAEQARAVLLETYPTEAAIAEDFTRRAAVLEGQKIAAQAIVEDKRKNLTILLEKAGEVELAGRPVLPRMVGNISEARTQVAQQVRSIRDAEEAIAQMQAEKNATIEQWRIGKGLTPAPVPEAAATAATATTPDTPPSEATDTP